MTSFLRSSSVVAQYIFDSGRMEFWTFELICNITLDLYFGSGNNSPSTRVITEKLNYIKLLIKTLTYLVRQTS